MSQPTFIPGWETETVSTSSLCSNSPKYNSIKVYLRQPMSSSDLPREHSYRSHLQEHRETQSLCIGKSSLIMNCGFSRQNRWSLQGPFHLTLPSLYHLALPNIEGPCSCGTIVCKQLSGVFGISDEGQMVLSPQAVFNLWAVTPLGVK